MCGGLNITTTDDILDLELMNGRTFFWMQAYLCETFSLKLNHLPILRPFGPFLQVAWHMQGDGIEVETAVKVYCRRIVLQSRYDSLNGSDVLYMAQVS